MSTAEIPEGAPEELALVALVDGPKVRAQGLDMEHAVALSLVVDQLPPIHVVKKGRDYAILSGAHRVKAHVIAGRDYISAYVLQLPRSEWFMYAVNANREHGKAPTLMDRKFIAAELLKIDPEMSSNAVAEAAGLSPTTVGKMRGDQGEGSSGVQNGHLSRRGTDGKKYPVTDKNAAAERAVMIRSLMDDGLTDADIQVQLGCSIAPVVGERKRWLADNPPRNETSSDRDPAPGAGESGGEAPSQDLPAASLPDGEPGGSAEGDGADEPDEAAAPPADESDASDGGVSSSGTPVADSPDPDGHATDGSEKGPGATPEPVASGPTELRAKASAAVAAVQKSGLTRIPARDAAAVLAIDDREARTEFCYELIRWATDHLAGLDVTTGPRGIA